jgi:hypothetical protein
MNQPGKIYKIFLASPGDLPEERATLRSIAEEINAGCFVATQRMLVVRGWEDISPIEGRPQAIINPDVDDADLFIGCLYQKMGSPSGEGDKTGFEEEFDRARTRFKKAGKPHISLFFKRVEAVRLVEPDDKLRAVLTFRQKLIEDHEFIFKEFTNVAEWRDLVHKLLLEIVLAEFRVDISGVTPSQAGVTQTQAEVMTDDSAESGVLTPALKRLAELVRDTSAQIGKGRSSAVVRDEAKSVRLLLFAATNYDWFSQHIQFGAHEINSLFRQRTEFQLTEHERLFILRTLLLDPFLTKPGWFWIKGWSLKPANWIVYFTTQDSDPVMRAEIVQLASLIGFPLNKAKVGRKKPIAQILKDKELAVRLKGLEFLARVGTISDLDDVRFLLGDSNKNIRAQAEQAIEQISIRADPDKAIREIIESGGPVTAQTVASIGEHIGSLSILTLHAVAGHPNNVLREHAAKELLRRGAINSELANLFCKDESRSVREQGYIALVRNKQSIDMAKMRADLQGSFLLSGDADQKRVAHVMENVFVEQSDDELWQQIETFAEHADISLKVIGRRSFDQFRERIQTQLLEDFASFASAGATKTSKPELPGLGLLRSQYTSSAEPMRKRLVLVATELIADQPQKEDRALLLRLLAKASNPQSTRACLRGLQVVGESKDRKEIIRFIPSTTPAVQVLATQTYLLLSPNPVDGAKVLLEDSNARTPFVVWSIIGFALKEVDTMFFPVLKPLLNDDSEDIRRMVCFFAQKVLTSHKLGKLLDDYLQGLPYFYNVVALLDRVLYGPSLLKSFWEAQEFEYHEKKWIPQSEQALLDYLEFPLSLT